MYLLDTNVVSELRRARPHGGVLAWVSGLPREAMYISAVTCGEIQVGIENKRNKDAVGASELQAWLERLIESYRVLPMDEYCFRQWARLIHRRSHAQSEDAMIAATAIVHRLVVATHDADFQTLGVETIDPWSHGRS